MNLLQSIASLTVDINNEGKEKKIERSMMKTGFAGEKGTKIDLLHRLLNVSSLPQDLLIIVTDYTTELWNGQFIRSWGRKGSRKGELQPPSSLFTDGQYLYISEINNNRIQVFNTQGDYISHWGQMGSKPNQFRFPACLALYHNLLYVTDSGNERVQVFTVPDAKFFFQWKCYSPCWGITIFENLVYLTLMTNHLIQVYSLNGTKQNEFGKEHLKWPTDITVDKQTIYVVDSALHQIVLFSTSNHQLQTKWGQEGEQENEFSFPNRCLLLHDGSILISDAYWIRRLDKTDGKLLQRWGGKLEDDVEDKGKKIEITLKDVSGMMKLNEYLYVAEMDCIKVFN